MKEEIKSLSMHELVERASYAKGQIQYLQAMITKRSAEMVCAAIRQDVEAEQNIKMAMDQHLDWLNEANEYASIAEGEIEHRRAQERKR